MKSSRASFSLILLSLFMSALPFYGSRSSDRSRGYSPLEFNMSLLPGLLPTPTLLFEALFLFPRINWPVFWIKLSRMGETIPLASRELAA